MSLDVGMGYIASQVGQLCFHVGSGLFHFSYRKTVRKEYLSILIQASISGET